MERAMEGLQATLSVQRRLYSVTRSAETKAHAHRGEQGGKATHDDKRGDWLRHAPESSSGYHRHSAAAPEIRLAAAAACAAAVGVAGAARCENDQGTYWAYPAGGQAGVETAGGQVDR